MCLQALKKQLLQERSHLSIACAKLESQTTKAQWREQELLDEISVLETRASTTEQQFEEQLATMERKLKDELATHKNNARQLRSDLETQRRLNDELQKELESKSVTEQQSAALNEAKDRAVERLEATISDLSQSLDAAQQKLKLAAEQQLAREMYQAKLRERRDSTWLPPPVVPVANKPGGTAVGFVGKSGGERWLLKLGMDKTEGHKATASILSKSVAVRGMATDAIKEVVATAAFKVL